MLLRNLIKDDLDIIIGSRNKMNRFFKHIGVIAGVFLLISCGDDKAAQQQGQAQAQQAMPFPVINIPTKTITGYNSYPTRIEGIVNSEVRAKVQGYIDRVLVDEGQKVSKGQPLFKLETQSLTQDAAAAKANVNAAGTPASAATNTLLPAIITLLTNKRGYASTLNAFTYSIVENLIPPCPWKNSPIKLAPRPENKGPISTRNPSSTIIESGHKTQRAAATKSIYRIYRVLFFLD